ncbi:MAG TPA: Uma2 family endonuclease [Thermoanaerobaculia bacterium]|nr:Uma2 family endonuclease [Thermoanaerobaculia bacterium]
MSQPAVAALASLPFELVFDDGEPLETEWHTVQLPLLRKVIRQRMLERERRDFYVGGNMFVYYSVEQARDVAKGRPYFMGPDVFWVGGVEPDRKRKGWVSWQEGGRLPDVIVELLSPTTAEIDRTMKKDLYARVFRTSEYYLYDPDARTLEGLRLVDRFYQPMAPDPQGRLWSEQLGAFLGLWQGRREGLERTWVRLFRPDGSLVPTGEERAVEAEAELGRLRAQLERRE